MTAKQITHLLIGTLYTADNAGMLAAETTQSRQSLVASDQQAQLWLPAWVSCQWPVERDCGRSRTLLTACQQWWQWWQQWEASNPADQRQTAPLAAERGWRHAGLGGAPCSPTAAHRGGRWTHRPRWVTRDTVYNWQHSDTTHKAEANVSKGFCLGRQLKIFDAVSEGKIIGWQNYVNCYYRESDFLRVHQVPSCFWSIPM